MNTEELPSHKTGTILVIVFALMPSLGGLLLGLTDVTTIGNLSTLVILQTAGGVVAIATVLLCIVNFRRSGEVSVPVLSIGLMCAGILDIWQASRAAMLVDDPENYIFVSWAFTRTIFAIGLLLAAAVSPMTEQIKGEGNRKRSTKTTLISGLIFLVVSFYFMIRLQVQPAFIDRLWEGTLTRAALTYAPLALLLLAACYVLPVFRKWHRSALSKILIIACVPMILAQLHLSFNQEAINSVHFFVANLAKLSGYCILFIGMLMDYDEAFSKLDLKTRALRQEVMLSHQTEGAMSQHDLFHDKLMAELELPVCYIDTSLKALRVNQHLARLGGFGLGAKAIPLLAVGKEPEQVFGKEAGPRLRALVEEVFKSSDFQEAEVLKEQYNTGDPRSFHWRAFPVTIQNETVATILIGTPQQENE